MSVTNRCAARGANLMDRKSPGWADKINLNSLNMRQSGLCVIGQCYGNYFIGCHKLGLNGLDEIRYGFTFILSRLWSPWDKLNAAWIPLIEKRQTAKRQSFATVVIYEPRVLPAGFSFYTVPILLDSKKRILDLNQGFFFNIFSPKIAFVTTIDISISV